LWKDHAAEGVFLGIHPRVEKGPTRQCTFFCQCHLLIERRQPTFCPSSDNRLFVAAIRHLLPRPQQDKVEEDSLYAALDSLVSYQIFEPNAQMVKSLYDMLDDVTVIELAGYSPQIQNLVVALTLDLFYSQMQKRGKPTVKGDFRQITKMVLVDEADNFMKEDFQSLRKILKEGREYGVGVILSTQDITHFKTGENNYASYILTWVVHRVAEIKNADIKAIFNKDDKTEQEGLMETIRRLEKHYSLYIDGDKLVRKMRDKAFWEL
jgi:DNA phosphorothioation-dependent restriction protein DptH